jgi:hypothetical protein
MLSDANLLFISIAIWVGFIALLAYYTLFKKPISLLPSGNVAVTPQADTGVS